VPASIARLLRAAGHDCAQVHELGLGGRPDEQIMALADRENRISSPRTPTSANSSPTHPFQRPASSCAGAPAKRAEALAAVILANLGQVADDLDAGALIVISDTRIRTRRLPVKPSG
jgi:hypothetical protein